MRPLTLDRPKVLCPIDGVPLIDHAIGRLRQVTTDVAVNVHRSQQQLREHLGSGVHVSVESGDRLGTAGALGQLRSWIDGRPTVIVNGDTWCPGGLDALVEGWDGTSIRILVGGTESFGPASRIAGALMPWDDVARLDATPSGLWEVSWRSALEQDQIESVHHHGPLVDCASPADYLTANLQAAGGSSVGTDAVVAGVIENCVVWDGAVVGSSEHLKHAIRTDTGRTVLIRRQ